MRLISLILVICASTSFASEFNSTGRSRRAITAVKPALEEKLKAMDLAWGVPVFLRIFKHEKQLEVWVKKADQSFEIFATYEICYFSGTPGPKRREGDRQTPEGFYATNPKLMNPWSSYHLSFNIGYPNSFDRSYGRTGSLIMVHGSCVSIGCFAMTNKSIEEIWAMVDAAQRHGQKTVPIHSFPFNFNNKSIDPQHLAKGLKDDVLPFWENLKEGFHFFETHKRPPVVSVKQKRYQFR